MVMALHLAPPGRKHLVDTNGVLSVGKWGNPVAPDPPALDGWPWDDIPSQHKHD